MLNETLPGTFITAIQDFSEALLSRTYFFHDVQVTCYTNHPTMLTLLDEMLGIYNEPEELRGKVTYYVLCYESALHFPVQLPYLRKRTEAVDLPTNTQLKCYVDYDNTIEYQSFKVLTPANRQALNAVSLAQHVALTQIEMPERYQAQFLRRYVLLLALGLLLRQQGFEPCHAASVTAPSDSQSGALIIGESGSGKTTLSLGCASLGFGLLGDDLVMLRENDADGMIHAYSIMHEVSVRSGTIDLWSALSFLRALPIDFRDKRYCTIEQVHSGATRFQTPIRLLVFPTFLSEATKPQVKRLSKAKALQVLLDQCLSKLHSQSREKSFWLLSQLAEQAPGYQLAIAHGTHEGPRIISSLLAGDTYG